MIWCKLIYSNIICSSGSWSDITSSSAFPKCKKFIITILRAKVISLLDIVSNILSTILLAFYSSPSINYQVFNCI